MRCVLCRKIFQPRIPHTLGKVVGVIDKVHERPVKSHSVQVLHPVGDTSIGLGGGESAVSMETIDQIDQLRRVILGKRVLDMQIPVALEGFPFLRRKRMPQAVSVQCLASHARACGAKLAHGASGSGTCLDRALGRPFPLLA